MRKFTLILVSMFLTLGAWAQVYVSEVSETKISSAELNAKTEATYIAIKNLSATNHYYYVGNTGAVPYSKAGFSNDAVFIWEPVTEGTPGSYYLRKLNGDYMQKSSPKDFGTVTNAAVFTTTNPTSKGGGSTYFNGDGDSQAYISGNDDPNLVRFVNDAKWINVQNGDGGTPTYNTGLGGWTIHYVYSVNVEEVSAVNVTYQYVLDGVVKKSVTVEQAVGSAYDAPAIDYVTFENPTGTATADATVQVTCTQNLPFTVSTDYADATWYYMTIRSNNQKYVARSEKAPYANSKTITAGDDGLWAFKGNVFDGIQVINKGAGDGFTLGYAGTATASNISMTEAETTWTIEEGNGGFILGQGENVYAHDYNSQLQIWNDASAATDAGSAFNVFTAEEVTTTQKTALQALIEKAGTYEAGTTIGYYTEASVASLATPLANANTALSSSSLEDVLNATTELQDAINDLKLILPEKGKFYRIKSVNSDNYVTAPANTGVQMTLNADASANNILYWDAEGHLLVYGTGYYINGKNHAHFGYKDTYTIEGSKTGVAGACAIKPGSANYWHDNGANLDVYQNGTHANCNWTIEEVTTLPVAVSAAGYATLYAPVALTIADGVTAYTAAVEGETLVLNEVEGTIPANTGVILEADPETYNFAVAADVAAIEGNALVGAYAKSAKKADAKVYTLQKPAEKEVGFYLFNGQDANENKTYINGFRAWVEVANGGAAPAMFSLGRGEGTTAIGSVELTNDNVVIYDLAGRRVEKMEKGIYIVNGKKVIR